MMRSIFGILPAAFLLAFYGGYQADAQDWLGDLLSGVNYQVDQINRDVNDQVARIHQDVNQQVNRINEDVRAQIARTEEIAKNAKPGQYTSQGNTVVVTGGQGYYHTFNSGVDSKGNPYSIEIEDKIQDGVLRHTERIYNSTTKKTDTYVSVRKLSDPNAQPIFNNFTSNSQKE